MRHPASIFAMWTYLYCSYYKESEKILGNTYGMLVLQDFEAITPNLLARTIETVEGGGLVVLLLKTMTSLKQLYTMTMVRKQSIHFHTHTLTRRSRMYTLGIARPPMIQLSQDSMNDSFYLSAHVLTVLCWTTN